MRRVVRPVREAGVADIELLLVRREAKAVGLHEVIDDHLDVTGFRIHPVDVVLFLLGLGLDALVKAADAVGGIAEPDRTVGSDDRVVRRVQLLAIVLVGDDRDRAVEFGPGDPPAAMFASDQASFPIDGVAVRVHRRLAVYAEVTVILRETHDAVVGNVAEQHVAPSREVDRSLGPAEPGRDALDRHGAGEGRKTVRPERNLGLLGRLQARIRIAAPGKRPQGQRLGRRVGAPVWPSGATVAAEAAFIVTAEAASAAAPVSILRRSKPPRSRWGSGKVSEVVMISSHGFLLGGKHRPAIRHKAGRRYQTTKDRIGRRRRPGMRPQLPRTLVRSRSQLKMSAERSSL